MKKQLLMLAFAMAAMTAPAQIVVWNGEDKVVDTNGGFWNRADPTVVEEGGNKCLKITTKAKTGDWDNEHFNAHLPFSADFNGLRRLSFRIKMEPGHNVLLKLKHGSAEAHRLFYYGGGNTWEKLNFEFSVGPNKDDIADNPDDCWLEIWPFEDNAGTHDAGNVGKVIYIDDIQVEGPMVGGSAIRTLADGALTDQQVIVTGSLSKGQYQDTWSGGPWVNKDFDDYTTLTSKISAGVCFLNLTGAAVADGDSPQLRTKNPNLLILSPSDFSATDNVIRWDGVKSRNNTPKMVLTDANPFYTPIDFHADAVEVTRNLKAGINSLCLPFYVGQAEISTNCKIATFKSGTTFTYVDHADANTPFLATAVDDDAEKLNFTDKGVVNTPVALGTTFVGVYAPQSAVNLYGINDDGKLQKGGSGANIKSFRAYLTAVDEAAREISFEGDVTGIENLTPALSQGEGAWYDLQGRRIAQPTKGLYIVNGKKVFVP